MVTSDTRKNEENLAIFLGLLGTIRPRYYSIANSPSVYPNTVRVVYKVKERDGEIRLLSWRESDFPRNDN